MRWLTLLLLPLLLTDPLLAGSQNRRPKVSLRLFSEASESDSDKFATKVQLRYPPRQAYLNKIPQVSEFDVAAAFPFRASDGTFGCSFKLDAHGTVALDTMSVQYRKKSAVVVLNGRYVIDMLIDRRISDGILTIPFGLTEAEVAAIAKEWPPRKRGGS